MLRHIGVLILIDQNIAEKLTVMPQHIGIIAQEHIRIVEQIVKVHRTRHYTAVTVCAIYDMKFRTLGPDVSLHHIPAESIILRRDKRIFCR